MRKSAGWNGRTPIIERMPMLVLSRKKGESVMIDGGIIVTVVEVRGDKVRLGFEAPREVTIDRKEVFEKKKQGQLEVTKTDEG